MQEIIVKNNIGHIIFADFIQYKELYKYYSISNLLILSSREEVWGLVINEAMACGLPVITTKETGASIDLVEERKNGYIIKSNCPKCIAEAIDKVFKNCLDKENNSWEIVQKTRIENILEKIKL
jgi:glycosyltransferase involved in cell wall biosynthesis